MRLVGLALALATACHHATPVAVPEPPRGPIEGLATGSYGIATGTLTVKTVTPEELVFDLAYVTPTEGQHRGDIADGHARRHGADGYDFTSGEDCLIRLTASPPGVLEVEQKGPCASAGFGAYVIVSGLYSRAP